MKLIYVRDYFYLSSQLEVMQQSLHGHRHAALFCTRLLTAQENKAEVSAGGRVPPCSPLCSSPQEGSPRPAPRPAPRSGRHRLCPACAAQAAPARLRLRITSWVWLLHLPLHACTGITMTEKWGGAGRIPCPALHSHMATKQL